jgi:CRISPR-associated protein Csx16
MTTYFISRHPGAIEWVARQGINVDQIIGHLDPANVRNGDSVIGSLPVNLAAQVCARGAAYWHLSLEQPSTLRGQELSADDLLRLGARLEPFQIQRQTQVHHPAVDLNRL